MPTFHIDASEALKKLDIEGFNRVVGRAVNEAIDDQLRPAVREYPGPPTKKMKWKSDKQRRWFFWALRTGAIQVPYPRTGRLGSNWTKVVRRMAGGWRGEWNSNTPYAQHVIQSQASQAYLHKRRWWTVHTVARDKTEAIARFIERSLASWART